MTTFTFQLATFEQKEEEEEEEEEEEVEEVEEGNISYFQLF